MIAMRRTSSLVTLALVGLGAIATESTSSNTARDTPQFITAVDLELWKDGLPFIFNGTNAYWLASLESDSDVKNTMQSIAASGTKVVRIWAFNDVTEVPANGVWFQLIANGTTSINNGTNGLQRLDEVVSAAENEGIFLIMSLTNNWNPTGGNLPRNSLSNDYGGMDAYVREFGVTKKHDEFYTNGTIINIFQNYINQVIKRYLNSPAILSWEIANDPRCNSSISATQKCNTTTVTAWHATMANHIQALDPNHLISSGTSGFQCPDCPKLFKPKSPASSSFRKAIRGNEPRKDMTDDHGKLIVARQTLPNPTDAGLGPAMDGSWGIDTEDILYIKSIGFRSLQVLPDQNVYGPPDPNLSAFNDSVVAGSNTINTNAMLAEGANKPVVLVAFGLVTQNNSHFFVPVNGTVAPYANSGLTLSNGTVSPAFGVTEAQRDAAYTQWTDGAFQANAAGVIQYQWAQGGLTAQPGTNIVFTNEPDGKASSPNDGYQRALVSVTDSSSPSPGPSVSSSGSTKSFLKHAGAAAGTFTAIGLIVIGALAMVYLKLLRHRQPFKFGRRRDGDDEVRNEGNPRWMKITPFSDPVDSRGFVDLIPEVVEHETREGSAEFPAPPLSASESPPPYRTNTNAASDNGTDIEEQEVLPPAQSTPLQNSTKVAPVS